MADDVVKLRVEFEGAKTISELARLKREVRSVFELQQINGKEQLATGKLIADIENKLHAARQVAYGDNAKMMQSYFKLGTELRGVRFAALQAADSLGMTRGGMGFVMASLTGPGGAVTGLITGLAGMIVYMRTTREETEKLNRELKYLQAQDITGDQTKTRALKIGELGALKAKLKEAEGGYFARTHFGRYEDLVGAGAKKDVLELKLQIARLEKELELKPLEEITVTGSRSLLPLDREQRLMIEAQAYDRSRKQRRFYPGGRELTGRAARRGGGVFGDQGVGGIDTGRLAMEEMGREFSNLAEADRKAQQLAMRMQPIKDAAIEAGEAIQTHIVGALSNALNLGSGLASEIFGIVLRLGISSIFSVATGGVGAVAGGGGMSMGGAWGAQRAAGGGRIIPIVGNRRGGGGNMASAINALAIAVSSGVWRVQGTDLVYGVRAGERSLNAKS